MQSHAYEEEIVLHHWFALMRACRSVVADVQREGRFRGSAVVLPVRPGVARLEKVLNVLKWAGLPRRGAFWNRRKGTRR